MSLTKLLKNLPNVSSIVNLYKRSKDMKVSKSHELIKYIREYFLDSNDIDSKNLAIYLLDCSEIYIAIKERENELKIEE